MAAYRSLLFLIVLILIYSCAGNNSGHGAGNTEDSIALAADSAAKPIMQEYNIPGMAIGVTVNGKRSFYNYGITSKNTQQAVTNETLFEIGSISKTFTATLAAYAQAESYLSLTDSVSKYLPSLRGSSLANVQLFNLGTHTAGGFPLQLPDDIKDTAQLMQYYQQWHPDYAAGTYRVYSNPGIGLLGVITARRMQQPFAALIEKKLFPELGMEHSYINVPADKMPLYAQGYNSADSAVRLNPAVLATEVYAIKSCTKDLIQFTEANMGIAKLNAPLQQAVMNTHTGYFRSGVLTQDLIWEQYPYPTDLKVLLAGNSESMIFEANPAAQINPVLPPQENVLINKTGSTNGFSAYILFVPSRKTGIVVLTNKSYPIAARIQVAFQVLAQLEKS